MVLRPGHDASSPARVRDPVRPHPPLFRSTAEGPGHLITTTTTLPPIDTSAVDPAMSPSPSPPSRSSAEGLPRPRHHLHHPFTSIRARWPRPRHVTSPPVSPFHSSAEGPAEHGHHIHHLPTSRYERGGPPEPGYVTFTCTTLPLERGGSRPPHHHLHLPPFHPSAETRPRCHPSHPSEGPDPTMLPRHPPPSRSSAQGPGRLIITTTSHLSTPLSRPGHVTASPTTLPLERARTRPPH